jgi:hypothetical protein
LAALDGQNGETFEQVKVGRRSAIQDALKEEAHDGRKPDLIGKIRHPKKRAFLAAMANTANVLRTAEIVPTKYSDRSAIIEVDRFSFAPSVGATTPVQRARGAGLNV